MAYLLERDPLNGEGGKIVFEGHEIAKVENVHVEVDNREELKLDDLKEIYVSMKRHCSKKVDTLPAVSVCNPIPRDAIAKEGIEPSTTCL